MKKYAVFLLLGFFAWGCRDIIEKDITDDTVDLVSPADSLKSTSLTQTFYWSELDGIEGYRIQISRYNFSNSISILLDSTVKTNQFTYSLPVGVFQWRVAGVNSGYASQFSTPRTLYIDSSAEVQGQVVVLVNPSSATVLNTKLITLKWLPISVATSYGISIDSGNGSGYVWNIDTKSTDNTYALTVSDQEHTYSWKVQAVGSGGGRSDYSNPATFTTDFSAPTLTIKTPDDGARLPSGQDSVVLSWTVHDANGVVSQSLEITDSLSKPISLSRSIVKTSDTTSTYMFVTTSFQKFYWRPTATDKAGNTNKAPFRSILFFQ